MMENECRDARDEPIEEKLIAACADGGYVKITPEKWERVRSLLDSYANALVAAAVSECAMIAQIPHGCSCEGAPNNQGAAYCHFTTASAIRSTVTPESAAKELERIKAEARLDELEICGNSSIPILDHYGRRKAYLEKRIAELEAAKEK